MKMRAGYLADISKVEIKEIDVPELDANSVLIKVHAAGVCGSDFHAFHGTHPFRKPPMILGHEAAGEVVKVGDHVKKLRVGDRVTVEPVKTCGKCHFCLTGQYNLCPDKIMAGVGEWLGTFADYFVIEEERAHLLPEGIGYDTGVLAEPLAVAAHAVKLADIKRGATCVVLGTGTIGLLVGVAAQEAGASRVYCTDVNKFRLQIAKQMGLHPIKVDEVSLDDTVKAFAPDGPDVVFLAVSSASTVNQALKLVKRGGKVIIIAVFNDMIMFDMNSVQANEIAVKGSTIYTKEDFISALNIMVNRKDLNKIITHHVTLDELNEMFVMLQDPYNTAMKIIVIP